jgi:peptidoglycan hydrolase-like protein with peptidoglycan-binding domain
MIIRQRRRAPSPRTPYNKNTKMVNAKRSISNFFKRYSRAMRKRNSRTIIFTAVVVLIFVVLPVVLIVTLTGSPDVQASSEELSEDAQMAIGELPTPSPSVSPTPSPTPVPTPILLAYGDENPTVILIQERLLELGYLDFLVTTEHFGTSTQAAVMLFERQLGQDQTGIVDDALYEALMSPDAEMYTLYLDAEGDDVRYVQERLYQMGYIIEQSHVTGFFGEITRDAVMQFQKTNSITADGRVGIFTLEALYDPEAKANIISFGEKSDIVLEYQKRLKALAYLTTEPDGDYGKDTTAAVQMFQAKNGLVVDGYLGPATRDLLDSSDALPNALTIGDSGNTVLNVQKMLVDANCLTGSSTTGYYGSVTEAAVLLFQVTNNLARDGKAGKQTIGLLTAGGYTDAATPITSGSVGSTPSAAKVAEMLAVARSKMGAPYVRGAKGPDRFDCSGFVYWVLNQIGVKQSYLTTYGWRSMTKYTKITDINALKPGDIILFHLDGLGSTRGHMGIVSTDSLMIHALNEDVRETGYKQSYWRSRFICAYRIF